MCDNNLASELVEKKKFFKPITIEEIVIFMITSVKSQSVFSYYPAHSCSVVMVISQSVYM